MGGRATVPSPGHRCRRVGSAAARRPRPPVGGDRGFSLLLIGPLLMLGAAVFAALLFLLSGVANLQTKAQTAADAAALAAAADIRGQLVARGVRDLAEADPATIDESAARAAAAAYAGRNRAVLTAFRRDGLEVAVSVRTGSAVGGTCGSAGCDSFWDRLTDVCPDRPSPVPGDGPVPADRCGAAAVASARAGLAQDDLPPGGDPPADTPAIVVRLLSSFFG